MGTKRQAKRKRPDHDGTVYYDQKNDRWIGQLPAVRRWDGTMKRPSVTGQTKTEAIDKLRLLAAQALSPEAVDPSKLTVKEWIDVYFEEFKNEELSPTTIRYYRSIMEQGLSGEVPAPDFVVNPEVLDLWKSRWLVK